MNNKESAYCLHILNHYGWNHQKIQAVQELSELILALSRRDNQASETKYVTDIAEEIADVYIMIEQIKLNLHISDDEIRNIVNYKLERQLQRIKDEEDH